MYNTIKNCKKKLGKKKKNGGGRVGSFATIFLIYFLICNLKKIYMCKLV